MRVHVFDRRAGARRSFLAAALLLVATALIQADAHATAQDAAAWAVLDDGSGPVGRWDHTLAYDPETDRAIVFGGRDGEGTTLGDTWLHDLGGGTWEALDGPAPAPRFGQAVALDAEARALYLFGGQDGPVFYADTWRLDLDDLTWERYEVAGAAPAARYGLPGVIDAEGNFIVSHGFTDEGRFDDTWSFDPDSATWTDISPAEGEDRPLRRCLHDGALDPDADRFYLYGGCASGFGPCPLGDLWAYDVSAGSWELVTESGPAPRDNPGLVHLPESDSLLLFGGRGDGGRLNDLWRFDLGAGTWEQIAIPGEAPSARSSHDAVLAGDRLLLFGGFTGEAVSAGLWSLDLAALE